MNIESFQLFAEVYQHRSFASVAKARNIAPSSVTRTIAILEKDLGFRLFHRTTRKVSPTEEGEQLYSHITNLLEEFGSIKNKLQNESTSPSGTLRVTANVSFNQIFLTKIIPKFRNLYPDISLEIKVTDNYVDILGERMDVAIRFGKIKDSDFKAIKLFDLEYVVVTSPNHLKETAKPRLPSDLNDLDCISLLLSQYHSVWKFRKQSTTSQVKINPKIKATGALSLIEYCKQGCGYALLPKFLIQKDLDEKNLVQVLKSYEATPTDFGSSAWMIFPSTDYLPARTRSFLDFVKKELTS